MSAAPLPSSNPVLIVGGGPIGMLTALQLAACNVKCVLVERNDDTTQYPKMEYANMRSMELMAKLSKAIPDDENGLLKELREIAVPGHYPMLTIYGTDFGEDEKVISTDLLPPPDFFTEDAKLHNDGSRHSQTPLRCSQMLVEAELKRQILKFPDLINAHWTTKFESLEEHEDKVSSQFTDLKTGEQFTIESQYVVGCDGGGSRVRRFTGRKTEGDGPMPMIMYLIHFRSHDFDVLRRHGRFWHHLGNGMIIISQDEDCIWTLHRAFPADTDFSALNPEDMLREALGRKGKKSDVQIDEILITGKWQPAMYVVDDYRSIGGRVFLAGDAAHQRIPAGGYGFNTGIGDAIDLGWKLGAVFNSTGSPGLLSSYNLERRPVSVRNSARALEHWGVQMEWWSWIEPGRDVVSQDNDEGKALRKKIDEHLQANKQAHRDYGTEAGYRYNGSPIVVPDTETEEPISTYEVITPTTWPGSRAPHVFLKDGEMSTHDFLGSGLQWTLFDFTVDQRYATDFGEAAAKMNVLLKSVPMHEESHVRRIYERDAVLVRPDGHVAWRSKVNGQNDMPPETVWRIVLGHEVLKA